MKSGGEMNQLSHPAGNKSTSVIGYQLLWAWCLWTISMTCA